VIKHFISVALHHITNRTPLAEVACLFRYEWNMNGRGCLKPTIDQDKMKVLREQRLGATDIGRQMKIGRSTA
jgi:hypothetical protein